MELNAFWGTIFCDEKNFLKKNCLKICYKPVNLCNLSPIISVFLKFRLLFLPIYIIMHNVGIVPQAFCDDSACFGH